ncbi:hypothetical protein BLNAU_1603 [Blattamonas nauphoetae]|uniref:Uncharacterized protein n=1 Tax=Blattamonas nauphoetae TaxID=2049346 RepID=A0ABQ9YIS4_9EUKA|nr:hypothetical protein BLNAU_1603 [Blattamonas nauphoetae]
MSVSPSIHQHNQPFISFRQPSLHAESSFASNGESSFNPTRQILVYPRHSPSLNQHVIEVNHTSHAEGDSGASRHPPTLHKAGLLRVHSHGVLSGLAFCSLLSALGSYVTMQTHSR